MAPDERVGRLLRGLLVKLDLDHAARRRLVDEVVFHAPSAADNRPVIALIAVDLDRY
jgi:hypothetical protein